MLAWLETFISQVNWWLFGSEWLGKTLGGLTAILLAAWLSRKQLKKDLQRLREGDSDDILFSVHYLKELPNDEALLYFRNVGPPTTVNGLFDNTAARRLIKELAANTSIREPWLKLSGTPGFELLNHACNYICGHMSTSPFPRENWILVLTAEDRNLVRKSMTRVFAYSESHFRRFLDWDFCTLKVRTEKPWHAPRIVATHFLAKAYFNPNSVRDESLNQANLAERHLTVKMFAIRSIGFCPDELPLNEGELPDWEDWIQGLNELGANLPAPSSAATSSD